MIIHNPKLKTLLPNQGERIEGLDTTYLNLVKVLRCTEILQKFQNIGKVYLQSKPFDIDIGLNRLECNKTFAIKTRQIQLKDEIILYLNMKTYYGFLYKENACRI